MNTMNCVQRDYFAMRPVMYIAFQDITGGWHSMTDKDQDELLNQTIRHPKSTSHPPSIQYKISFTKFIIKKLEDSGVEVCDALYEDVGAFMGMSQAEEGDMCFKTYIMPDGVMLSLKESKNLISKGTTGLRTWQAAQFLAEWAHENKELLKDKNILELGSGLGFTGLVVCKQCQPKSFTFSDCHSDVMYYLSQNIQENVLNLLHSEGSLESKEEESKALAWKVPSSAAIWEPDMENWVPNASSSTRWQHKTLHFMNLCLLDWEKLTMENVESLIGDVDVIIAADVVYDSSIIPPLVQVLKMLLDQPSKPVAFIASTVRNEKTRDEFFSHLDNASLKRAIMEGPNEQFFVYDRSTPIEILKLQMDQS